MKKRSTREEGQFDLPILGSQAADISAEALFDTWLQHQRPPMAPSTQRVYRTLWRRFLQALQDHKKAVHPDQACGYTELFEQSGRSAPPAA